MADDNRSHHQEMNPFRPAQAWTVGVQTHRSLRRFHTFANAPADAIARLQTAGFVAVAPSLTDAALRLLCRDGWLANFPEERTAGLSLLSRPDGVAHVLVRPPRFPSVDNRGRVHLEIVGLTSIESQDQTSQAILSIGEVVDCSSMHLSTRESLLKDLDGPSVNGKLLLRADVQRACRDCYDDNYREAVRAGGAGSELQRRATSQGLWLEHLVADVCLSSTGDVWVGQMSELFEFDVLAIVDGQLIMFECKDGPLGQNDFLVTFRKAHDLNADVLVLVSTRPLHHNVKRTIRTETARSEEDGVGLAVVCSPWNGANDFVTYLCSFIKRLKELTVYHWLAFDHTSAAAPSFFAVDNLDAGG
jgi:hypothetical protein